MFYFFYRKKLELNVLKLNFFTIILEFKKIIQQLKTI